MSDTDLRNLIRAWERDPTDANAQAARRAHWRVDVECPLVDWRRWQVCWLRRGRVVHIHKPLHGPACGALPRSDAITGIGPFLRVTCVRCLRIRSRSTLRGQQIKHGLSTEPLWALGLGLPPITEDDLFDPLTTDHPIKRG